MKSNKFLSILLGATSTISMASTTTYPEKSEIFSLLKNSSYTNNIEALPSEIKEKLTKLETAISGHEFTNLSIDIFMFVFEVIAKVGLIRYSATDKNTKEKVKAPLTLTDKEKKLSFFQNLIVDQISYSGNFISKLITKSPIDLNKETNPEVFLKENGLLKQILPIVSVILEITTSFMHDYNGSILKNLLVTLVLPTCVTLYTLYLYNGFKDFSKFSNESNTDEGNAQSKKLNITIPLIILTVAPRLVTFLIKSYRSSTIKNQIKSAQIRTAEVNHKIHEQLAQFQQQQQQQQQHVIIHNSNPNAIASQI
jgi:hypothetical protein